VLTNTHPRQKQSQNAEMIGHTVGNHKRRVKRLGTLGACNLEDGAERRSVIRKQGGIGNEPRAGLHGSSEVIGVGHGDETKTKSDEEKEDHVGELGAKAHGRRRARDAANAVESAHDKTREVGGPDEPIRRFLGYCVNLESRSISPTTQRKRNMFRLTRERPRAGVSGRELGRRTCQARVLAMITGYGTGLSGPVSPEARARITARIGDENITFANTVPNAGATYPSTASFASAMPSPVAPRSA